jgi:hypothetical protein
MIEVKGRDDKKKKKKEEKPCEGDSGAWRWRLGPWA